jgi:hypothetical protein
MEPLLLTAVALVLLTGTAHADTFPAKCEASSLAAAIAAANVHTGPDAVSLVPGCRYVFTVPDHHWYGANALRPISSDVTGTPSRSPTASGAAG